MLAVHAPAPLAAAQRLGHALHQSRHRRCGRQIRARAGNEVGREPPREEGRERRCSQSPGAKRAWPLSYPLRACRSVRCHATATAAANPAGSRRGACPSVTAVSLQTASHLSVRATNAGRVDEGKASQRRRRRGPPAREAPACSGARGPARPSRCVAHEHLLRSQPTIKATAAWCARARGGSRPQARLDQQE